MAFRFGRGKTIEAEKFADLRVIRFRSEAVHGTDVELYKTEYIIDGTPRARRQ